MTGYHGWNYLRYDPDDQPSELSRELLGRVWRYGRPYRRQLIGIVVTIFATAIIGVLPALLIRTADRRGPAQPRLCEC